ncbi:probable transmembrane ascorbate ferrireductase 4, partial [Olea europaea subsp. europaea]
MTWALYSKSKELVFIFGPVLHPWLMMIGFLLVSGEGINYICSVPGSWNLKKLVHLCLRGLALACRIFGIWTKFHRQDGIVANFYSLHSWMGLIYVSPYVA